MNRFMLFKENDDGTMTITSNVWGDELTTCVIEQSFESMAELMSTPELLTDDVVEIVAETTTFIPNYIGDQ